MSSFMTNLSAVAMGSNECGGLNIHILSYSTEKYKNKAQHMFSNNYLTVICRLHISPTYRARKGETYFSMDRERTADTVSSMHPNGPVSNCAMEDRPVQIGCKSD